MFEEVSELVLPVTPCVALRLLFGDSGAFPRAYHDAVGDGAACVSEWSLHAGLGVRRLVSFSKRLDLPPSLRFLSAGVDCASSTVTEMQTLLLSVDGEPHRVELLPTARGLERMVTRLTLTCAEEVFRVTGGRT